MQACKSNQVVSNNMCCPSHFTRLNKKYLIYKQVHITNGPSTWSKMAAITPFLIMNMIKEQPKLIITINNAQTTDVQSFVQQVESICSLFKVLSAVYCCVENLMIFVLFLQEGCRNTEASSIQIFTCMLPSKVKMYTP